MRIYIAVLFALFPFLALAGEIEPKIDQAALALKNGSADRAIDLLSSFSSTDARVAYLMGSAFALGGVENPRSVGNAIYWFQKAAGAGYEPAMVSLGRLKIEAGQPLEGFAWLEMAAKLRQDNEQAVFYRAQADFLLIQRANSEAQTSYRTNIDDQFNAQAVTALFCALAHNCTAGSSRQYEPQTDNSSTRPLNCRPQPMRNVDGTINYECR